MAKSPSVSTRIVARDVAPASTGLEKITGAFAKFAGQTQEIQMKKEDAQRDTDNRKANADLQRLIQSHPNEAKALKESGDFDSFFSSVGHKIDPAIMQQQPVFDNLRKTLGTHFAVQGRAELRTRLRKAPSNQTMSQAIALYIEEKTEGMSDGAANAFAGATAKFAEQDALGVSEERRRIANKGIRDRVKSNTSAYYSTLTEWNVASVGEGIAKIAEAYGSTDLDGVTALVRAGDDYERMVIAGAAKGEAWAEKAANVAYAGRPAMSSNSELANKIEDAKAEALRENIRIVNTGELKDVQDVRSLARLSRASSNTRDLNNFAVALHAGINKHRRGKLLPREWEALLDQLATQHKANAAKTVDISNFRRGLSYSDHKITEYLFTPEGLADFMRQEGIKDVGEGERRRNSNIATQSADGLGKKLKGVYTQDLIGQTDPAIAVKAYNDIIQFQSFGQGLPGVGRFYNKEAEHMVAFMQGAMSGKDRIPGTSDDSDATKAFEDYRLQVDRNDGELPDKAFLTARLGYKRTQVFTATRAVLSKFADLVGSDVPRTKSMEIAAKHALTMAAWSTSHLIKNGALASAEATIQRAAEIMQDKSELSVNIDEDGDMEVSHSPRASRLPNITPEQVNDFQRSAAKALPSGLTGKGYGLEADDNSNIDSSRIVTERQPDGSFAPFAIVPGVPIDIATSDENTSMVTSGFYTVTQRLPAAGEAGLITVTPPPVPERGQEDRPIGNDMFASYEQGAWRIRHVATQDAANIKSAQGLRVARLDQIERQSQDDTKKALEAEVKVGSVSEKAAADVDTSVGLSQSVIHAQQESIRDGSLFDTVDSPFIISTGRAIQKFAPRVTTPYSRKFNTQSTNGPDRIVGHGFNLDRYNAIELLSRAGVGDPKGVVAGKVPLQPHQMNQLQKESIRDTLVNLRKRIGKEPMSELSHEQLTAIVGMIETGSFGSKGRSDVLNPAMVKALNSGDDALVASLAEAGMVDISPGAGDVIKMSDADLNMLAMTRPTTPGLGKEIGKRRKAGKWNARTGKRDKRMVRVPSMTTTEARRAVVRAFRPFVPDQLEDFEMLNMSP